MNADEIKTYYLTVDGDAHKYWKNASKTEPKTGPIIIPQGTSTININLLSQGYTIHSWDVVDHPDNGPFAAPKFNPGDMSISIVNVNQNPTISPIDYHVSINVKTGDGRIVKCDPEVDDEGTNTVV